MKKGLMKLLGMLAVGAISMLVADPTFAQGLATMKGNLATQASAVTDIMSMIAYIGGVGLGIKGVLKLKEYSDAKGQIPLSQPVMILVVAALLLALPTVLSTLKGTVSSNTGTSINGTALQTVQ